jgi:tetratricopeptide (TPR) repeat protein
VCRFALGRVYLARGDYQKSVSELQAAIDLNPSMAQAHCGLGDVLTYSGRAHDAMACFEEAVRLSPQDPYRWAFLNYGAMALLFEGKFEEAADWAGRAAQVPNSHFWASAVQASALGHMGRLVEAREAIGELVRARPEISCEFVRERLFYLREPSQIETYIEGLRKAGLD